MTPSWVERTARICEVWRDGERSIRDHFVAADPDLSDRQLFTDAIESFLSGHPELCGKWQSYVDDKRSTPSPFMDLRGPITGWMSEGGDREHVAAFDSDIEACAHFLWIEARWVLKQSRATQTDSNRPDPRLGLLCVDLEKLVALLRDANANHWAAWLDEDLARIRKRDANGLTHLLSAYGGMGSFNDLLLDQRNGHTVTDRSKGFMNDQLAQLRSSIFRLTDGLRREIEHQRRSPDRVMACLQRA